MNKISDLESKLGVSSFREAVLTATIAKHQEIYEKFAKERAAKSAKPSLHHEK